MKEIIITWKPADKEKVSNYAKALGMSFNELVKDTMFQVLKKGRENENRRKK